MDVGAFIQLSLRLDNAEGKPQSLAGRFRHHHLGLGLDAVGIGRQRFGKAPRSIGFGTRSIIRIILGVGNRRAMQRRRTGINVIPYQDD